MLLFLLWPDMCHNCAITQNTFTFGKGHLNYAVKYKISFDRMQADAWCFAPCPLWSWYARAKSIKIQMNKAKQANKYQIYTHAT